VLVAATADDLNPGSVNQTIRDDGEPLAESTRR
jgi:hypothetical protein